MALVPENMADKILEAMAAVEAKQVQAGMSIEEYRKATMTALCKGIIDDINENAQVVIDKGSSTGSYKVL